MVLKGCNNTVKGICSVVSALFIILITGSLVTFPNLIKHYEIFSEGKIVGNKLFFITPAGLFAFNLLSSISGFLDEKLGTRILYIISSVLLLGSQLLIYFFKIYWILLIAYIIFGMANSLTKIPSLKNCWKYFPEQKGMISGIILSAFGLAAFVFTSIADGVIKSDPKDKQKEEGFELYLIIFMLCIILAGVISGVLCFPYKKLDQYIEGMPLIPEGENKDESPNGEKKTSEEPKNETKIEEKKKDEKTLRQTICSKDFGLCLTIDVCTLIFGFLLTNTYRRFGDISFSDKKDTIKTLSKAFTLLNTFSRIIWGFVADRVKFKILYSIACSIQIICGATIYFSSFNIVTYYIVTLVAILSYAGHVVLFPTLINTKFGVDKSVYLYGICGIFSGIAALIGPILTIFILSKAERERYLLIYLVGVAPTIASLIITIIIKVEPKPKEDPINNFVDDHYYDDVEEPEDEKEAPTELEIN